MLNANQLPLLVVEDELGPRELLYREATDLGFNALAASSARDAMDKMAQHLPAVVISDIRLPDMDGIALTRWIKQWRPTTEVILITGYGSVETAAIAIRLGVCDYVLKPFRNLDEIHQSLSRACQQYRERVDRPMLATTPKDQSNELLSLLEVLPLAVHLLDAEGTLRGSNCRGQKALGEQAMLLVGPNRTLLCANAQQQVMFEQLLQSARSLPSLARPRLAGSFMLKSADGNTRTPLLVIILASPVDGLLVAHSTPEVESIAFRQYLRSLYGFTPAESRLVALLLGGKSIEFAAARLGITTTTARSQLRKVFTKTGSGRQGELVSLVLSGPGMLCHPLD